jgi:4-amino-4-deoxychorismate lyase
MILVNGRPDARLDALDRGLAYGDGVFRTFRIQQGRPVWWADHYTKLAHDCQALALACPEQHLLLTEVAAVSAELAQGVVKIMVTRGAGTRGYALPDPVSPTRIVVASPLPDQARQATDGVQVRWCDLRLARQPRLAGVKHLNRLENVLARNEWHDPDIAEGLLCDDTGAVVGGTMSNLFIIHEGGMHTPDLGQAGVEGVARLRILQAAGQRGIDVQIRRLEPEEIMAADEVFLSNSVIGVWRVARLVDRQWNPAGWTEQFRLWMHEAN